MGLAMVPEVLRPVDQGTGRVASGSALGGNGAPLISVIVPTYNSAEQLSKLIESIVHQSFREFEVIVVDNYSADSTVRMSLLAGFKVVMKATNRVDARSFGVEISRGRFVLFVDSDQRLDVNCLQALVLLAGEYPRTAIVLRELSDATGAWGQLLREQDRIEFLLGLGLPRWFPRDLIARVAMPEFRGLDHVHGEDRLIAARLKNDGVAIRNCEKAVIYHADPPLLEHLQKQFRNTFTGTSSAVLGSYILASIPMIGSAANPFRVYSATRSTIVTFRHFVFLLFRTVLQVLGVVVSRLATKW
jgi:glycosyltransferase involved in cell wall biosynthesis